MASMEVFHTTEAPVKQCACGSTTRLISIVSIIRPEGKTWGGTPTVTGFQCADCRLGKQPPQPKTSIRYNASHGQFDVALDGFVIGRAQSHVEGERVIKAAQQALINECLTVRELAQLWSEELEWRAEMAIAEHEMQQAEQDRIEGLAQLRRVAA